MNLPVSWMFILGCPLGVSDYMRYYNERRRHGSIKHMAPNQFHEAFMNNTVSIKAIVA